MDRKALIIYCDDTAQTVLPGPPHDNTNYRRFLQSHIGGDWYGTEIRSLHSPTIADVKNEVDNFLSGSDYTFIIFTGHGYIEKSNMRQYMEVADGDISVFDLRTDAPKQTLIVDACRGLYSALIEEPRLFTKAFEEATGITGNTRLIFNNAVEQAEAGWSILYSANKNQSSLDTENGGAYLLSLLKSAESWAERDKKNNVLKLDEVHGMAVEYIKRFETIQTPVIGSEKRTVYFPFAVKTVLLHG